MKNLLDNFKDVLSIAQAGIKGTMESLKNAQSKAKKRTVSKRTPKKKVPAGRTTTPTARRKRNPSKLVMKARAAVPRKPSMQKPAKKSKSKYWP